MILNLCNTIASVKCGIPSMYPLFVQRPGGEVGFETEFNRPHAGVARMYRRCIWIGVPVLTVVLLWARAAEPEAVRKAGAVSDSGASDEPYTLLGADCYADSDTGEPDPSEFSPEALLGLSFTRRADVIPQDELQPLAVRGNADAQNGLGEMYLHDEDVDGRIDVAVKWFRRAAAQGHAAAQNSLGVLHFYGLGVPTDRERILAWFRKAAARGLAEAQSNLGYMHYLDGGARRDPVTAYVWYTRRAEKRPRQGGLRPQAGLPTK